MNQKTIKIVLVLTAIIIFLLVVLVYMQTISFENFSTGNLESFNNSGLQFQKNMNMVHNTALDPDDITDPVLNSNDVIYQTTKYQSLMNGLATVPAPSSVPVHSPVPVRGPSPGTSSGPSSSPLSFPTTVTIAFSDYKNEKGIDPFIDKTVTIQAYGNYFHAYPMKDMSGNAIYLPGDDDMYALFALNHNNNKIISCGWHKKYSDKAPTNNYPNKLLLYTK
jgi:hypothetical protein